MLIISSLWLGILTSISPCPLATNIAAVSFLGKRVDSPFYVLLSGLMYVLGRTVFYTGLGLILFKTIDSIPMVSHFLQTEMMLVVAPLMILVGLIVLKIIPLKLPNLQMGQQKSEKLAKLGLIGAFSLGFIFASALCAVSAALFFSNLINSDGSFSAMLAYGIGTGLPVMGFAFVLAFSINKIGKVYQITGIVEKYARILTGILFVFIGLYYVWSML